MSRLAPSPTGALHLGNARTFLINWALARQSGWRLLMRIEDLDGPRIKPDAAAQALETLAWLGLDWDGDVIHQSCDLSPYEQAMHQLAADSRAYACELSRREIEAAASAPHGDEHEVCFPVRFRPDPQREPQRFTFEHRETNHRFVVPEDTITVNDCFLGNRTFTPASECGDFVVWTRRGTPAYQLAVVVDDARTGVTDVVRGDDLLASAARQQLLYEALNLKPPRWWHVPLVVGTDGRRLAKRHGDTRIDAYRSRGVSAERIIGLLAYWSGVIDERAEMRLADFLTRFSITTLPRDAVVFTQEDHDWLIGA